MAYDCSDCIHEDTDMCLECSIRKDYGCTCFQGNPPCGWCENNRFEEK